MVTEDGLKLDGLEIFISSRLTNYHFLPHTKVTVYREIYNQYDRYWTEIS